ncbi:MAG: 50S ribosomal protein L15 [Sphaerochaetaceae bacterium]|jgi:large subunit ribosomal protein L15|nr:50S ribosomal protein L15 [Sphaerochaetaceae bacterium]HHU89243.1 50S ribosomal protein L15 [Spirochaetales bacterium]
MGRIKAPVGANKKKTIVGRGVGSKGRTSGRGDKGQNSRTSGGVRPGFEGGQMPLYRRIARRGFSNYPFKEEFEVVSLDAVSKKFEDGEVVSLATLKERSLVKGVESQAKVLANGELTKKVVFEGLKISAAAVKKIEAAGGEIR